MGEPSTAPLVPPSEEPLDSDEDLYAPVAPNPTKRQLRTARHHKAIDKLINMCRTSTQPQGEEEVVGENENRFNYDLENFPEALNYPVPMDTEPIDTGLSEYSPSLPQGDATNETHA